jgi:hypothetical protein
MSAPRLSTRIKQADLSPEVSRTFADGLREVIGAAQTSGNAKKALVARVLGALPAEPGDAAPFEALWPHGELFLTACVTVAVADGEYRVEEARLISNFAHRLGLSARQLAELERRTIRQIVERGAEVRRRDAARAAGAAVEAPEPTLRLDEPLPTDEIELTQPVVPPGGRR